MIVSLFVSAAFAAPAGMIDVKSVAPTVVVAMKYATADNFLGYAFYTGPEAGICWLTPATAEKVRQAEEIVAAEGYHLILYDCARPPAYQYPMWDTCVATHGTGHCSGLVANPYERLSGHTYGKVIDVGLVASDGSVIEIPSKYDSGLFPGDTSTDKARARPPASGSTTKPATWTDAGWKHYLILARALIASGFSGITSEWWHWKG